MFQTDEISAQDHAFGKVRLPVAAKKEFCGKGNFDAPACFFPVGGEDGGRLMLKIRNIESGYVPLVSSVADNAVAVEFNGISGEEIVDITDKISGIYLYFKILSVISYAINENFNGIAAMKFVIMFFSCRPVVLILAECHEI